MTTPCRIWPGGRNGDGYGVKWDQGRSRGAHVVAWEAVHGPVPDGLELDHLCGVRACVEVTHLEPVTHQENVRRGRAGEVQRARFQTELPAWNRARAATVVACPAGHPYDEANTIRSRGGRNGSITRTCRRCRNERRRKPR